MSQIKTHSRVIYEYEQNRDIVLQYAHGVWGGVNPQGEIEMSFYTESDKVPARSERIVAPDGSFGHEILPSEPENRTIVRNIHSKVLMSYHTAKALLEWLEEKVNLLEMEAEHGVPFADDEGVEQ